jgi:hypothetical protein
MAVVLRSSTPGIGARIPRGSDSHGEVESEKIALQPTIEGGAMKGLLVPGRRAEIARTMNHHILEAADRSQALGSRARMTFMCECGCMAQLLLTCSEYVGRGAALLPGHRTSAERARGRLLSRAGGA